MSLSLEGLKLLLKMAQVCSPINSNYPFKEKIIKNILNKGGNINQVIPASIFQHLSQPDLTGCTILHIAAAKRYIETFRILLDNGADFTMQNQRGCTVLHYLFDCEPDNSRNELINAVLSTHVKFANSNNPCNSDGITHIHIACMVNNLPAVQFFLANTISVHQFVRVDSPRFPGYSSLHFAAEGCSIETIKLLLKNNANMTSRDAQGRTALHVLLQQKIKLCDSLKESETDATKSILEKIDLIDDVLNLILQNNKTDGIGLSPLHIACVMQDSSAAEYFIEQTVDINHYVKLDSPVWPGYTGLHFAAHCNMKIFQMLIQKGATITAKNSEWLTPLDICFKNGKADDLITVLTSKPEWETAKFTNGKSLMELATMCKTLQLEKYLELFIDSINTQLVKNPPFLEGFTPLHSAVLISRDTDTEMIQLCLNRQANVSIQDVHGRTPIHLAFYLNKIEATVLLLQSYRATEDVIDKDGLSLDHIVQELIRLPSASAMYPLLTRWYNDDGIFEDAGSTWLHAAVYSGDCDLLNLRLKSSPKPNVDAVITCNDPKIFWSRYSGYTPLHLAIELSNNPQTVFSLLMNGADIFAARPDGMTPIYAVLNDVANDFHLLHRFVWQLETCDECRRRQRNLKLHLMRLSGITTLHVACRTFNVSAVKKSIFRERVDVNARVHEDCPIWSGYTALHVLLRYSIYAQQEDVLPSFGEILVILLDKGADVTAVDGNGDTPIHLGFGYCIEDDKESNFALANLLMDYQKNFSVNPVNAKKTSHFHIACVLNNFSAIDKFLNRGVDVNEPINVFAEKFGGDSPLLLALKRFSSTQDHLKAIDSLLFYGADVLAENSEGYTALHRAARDYSWDTELLEKLVSNGASGNAKNIFGETPMEILLKTDEISLDAVEVLLGSGCCLNSCNHITEEGYLSMIVDEDYHEVAQAQVFGRILEAPNLSNVDDMNRTAIHNVVTTRKANPNVVNNADIIDLFEKLGIDLDHQDILGKSALHLASQFGNAEAVAALINAGANINISDSNNKTALSYTLESEYRNDNIIKLLVVQFRKLQLLGLCDNGLNGRLLDEHNLQVRFDSEGLLREREDIRGLVVDAQAQLILDDFLLETEALTTYPFTSDSKRKKIEEFFKFSDKVIELKSALMFQYKKALKVIVV